ncbi:hypothetical protein [Actinomadura geliboluensis]|uniref:hypothetical protein n=1 Tax=Actinomadura geliboluensis TaxID=882440 RepID=UPI0036C788DD
MTAVLLLALALAVLVAVFLGLEARDLSKRLRVERETAEAAAAAEIRARTARDRACEARERAVLGYGEVLAQVEELATRMSSSQHDLVALQLQRLVDERLGVLRRL